MMCVEPDIEAILSELQVRGTIEEKKNVITLRHVIRMLIDKRRYSMTLLIDGSGSEFGLQPCDGSGRPVTRYYFRYASWLCNSGKRKKGEE
jgi:hypothetical protein